MKLVAKRVFPGLLASAINSSKSPHKVHKMDPATPRILAPYLEQFKHHSGPIRIVGKVSQLRGEQAVIDAGGQITLHLNRVSRVMVVGFDTVFIDSLNKQDSHLQVGHAVEVIGKVQQDLTVKVLNSTDLGTNVGKSSFNT